MFNRFIFFHIQLLRRLNLIGFLFLFLELLFKKQKINNHSYNNNYIPLAHDQTVLVRYIQINSRILLLTIFEFILTILGFSVTHLFGPNTFTELR